MTALFDILGGAVEEGLDLIATIVVAVGSLEAIIDIVRSRVSTNINARAIWVRYAHWLVVALTFELAADIVGTTKAPSWTDLAKLGAIAVIRTFLTYFLDRDLERAEHTLSDRPLVPVESSH